MKFDSAIECYKKALEINPNFADAYYNMGIAFKDKGDLIFLLGETVEDISSSEYLYSYHNVKESPAPYFDMQKEYDLHQAIKLLISEGRITAAHDCSDGGLFITLAEMGTLQISTTIE